MMEYEVWGRRGPVKFGATGVEEVLQNVEMFLCTHRSTVVMDREFGIDGSVIDRPINKAKAIISADIIRGLPRYEPRAKVISITFSGDGMDGVLNPKVKVRVDLHGFK